ncbi:uncharacterized protein LOC132505163 isoform X2 [Lagenorhynchus albirostris]|uniref:uncharacterized protein LOC132505163 isoform X2 n=1 Tax=Lagenorhynchus albirostris TaxID=27610 RepID=UPI0028E3E117|nr:uncharacterized protein LOC132505163 isoform X2 [Lagenorhynchus albirostris]
MELSVNDVDRTKKRCGLGRCKHFFWLGVAFDTVGATVMFTGVFADLLFYDLLLYLGSIIIFLSLLWWVFWYSGNIELSSEEPLNRPYHLPSATTLEVLSQTISNRFSFNMGSVSNTFMRMRPRRRHRQRFLQGSALDMTVTGQVENQLDQDKDGMEGAKESGDAQDFGSEDLPKPEAVKSLKGVCSLGPNAGPLGTEASLPRAHQCSYRFKCQVYKSTNTYLNLDLETSIWSPGLSEHCRLDQLPPPSLCCRVGRIFQPQTVKMFIARI